MIMFGALPMDVVLRYHFDNIYKLGGRGASDERGSLLCVFLKELAYWRFQILKIRFNDVLDGI